MTREELVTELKARGFDYLSDTRCSRYLNDAYLLDICETEDWPFLRTVSGGVGQAILPDLRSVMWVTDMTNQRKLKPCDPRELTDTYGVELSEPGTPTFWYMLDEKTIVTFPVEAVTLQVAYWRAPQRLVSSDSPIIPERFHTLIVDGAVARAYEDSDDYELAQNARENFEARLNRMRESLLGQNRDIPDEFIAVVDPGTAA